MYKILISAASSPAAASFSNYLRSQNYYTIGISDKRTNYADVIFDEFYVVPLISSDGFLKSLIDIEFDFYLPWIDEEIELLLNQKLISAHKFSIPSLETYDIVISKNTFFDWCNDNNLSVLEKTSTIPAFIRQNRSRGSRGAMHVNSQIVLNNYLNPNYISQKPISDGFREYTVDVFSDHEGNLICSSPRVRLDAKNISFVGIVEKNTVAESVAKKLSNKLRIPGMWNFQIFINNDEYYLVEVNSRLAGSVIFSILAGFPFGEYLNCLIIKNFQDFKCPDLKNICVERYLSEFVIEL
jgi:carbamoylphosphate synthase large subunit